MDDYKESRFFEADFTGARFHGVNFSNVTISDAWLFDVDISRPAEQLDQSVNEEWSFLETLRHLVFATDRWITGPVLGNDNPFHPLGMPNPPHDDIPPGVFDLDAHPTFAEVLAVRRERMDRVVFRDEWWHNHYANRDLAILERS